MTIALDTPQRPQLPELEASGFDAFLGSAGQRYLADGHRRVALAISPLTRRHDGAFHAAGSLLYPSDWSIKGTQDREPHLSTVDAMRIADEIRRALLAQHLPWLKDYALEQALHVRAGARPWVALDAVPTRTVVDVSEDADSVQLQHTIGSLMVTSTWVRGTAPDTPAGRRDGIATSVALQGADAATCHYARSTDGSGPIPFLEVLTLTAQLAQVILYGGDATARERSGNMWMRRAGFDRRSMPDTPRREVQLDLRNRRRLTVNEQVVDTAEVVAADVFGVYVTASLAAGA